NDGARADCVLGLSTRDHAHGCIPLFQRDLLFAGVLVRARVRPRLEKYRRGNGCRHDVVRTADVDRLEVRREAFGYGFVLAEYVAWLVLPAEGVAVQRPHARLLEGGNVDHLR